MRATDLTLGILVLLAGIGIYLSAVSFRDIPGQSYGAGTMPRAIAIAAVGVGLFIIGKAVLGGERGVGVRLEGWVRDAGALTRAATVLALIVLYIVVSPVLGFTPTALLVMTTAMLVLGTRPVPALLISAIATLVIQQSFGRLLLVPLPRSDFLGFLW